MQTLADAHCCHVCSFTKQLCPFHTATALFMLQLNALNVTASDWLACLQAKRKYQEVLAVKQQLDGDNQELQQKYSQKAM